MVMVSRGLTSAQIASITGHFHPVVMAWIDWPSGEVRAHSGVGTITWGGHSWTGVGRFGGISIPMEGLGLAAFGADLTLHGLPAELLEMLEEPVRNRPAEIWLASVTEPGGSTLRADPIPFFQGFVDAVRDRTSREDGDLAYEAHVRLGVGPSARAGGRFLHSYEDQIAQFPSDTAGRHLAQAREWGTAEMWPEP